LVITWSGQVRSGRWTWIWSWNGAYFAIGMPEGCWGWITVLYSLGLSSAVMMIECSACTASSATRTADSGPAAATKEEGVTHGSKYAPLSPGVKRRVRTVVNQSRPHPGHKRANWQVDPRGQTCQ